MGWYRSAVSFDDYLGDERARAAREQAEHEAREEAKVAPVRGPVADFVPIGKRLYKEAEGGGLRRYQDSDTGRTYFSYEIYIGRNPNYSPYIMLEYVYLNSDGHVTSWPGDSEPGGNANIAHHSICDRRPGSPGIVIRNGRLHLLMFEDDGAEKIVPLDDFIAKYLAREIVALESRPEPVIRPSVKDKYHRRRPVWSAKNIAIGLWYGTYQGAIAAAIVAVVPWVLGYTALGWVLFVIAWIAYYALALHTAATGTGRN